MTSTSNPHNIPPPIRMAANIIRQQAADGRAIGQNTAALLAGWVLGEFDFLPGDIAPPVPPEAAAELEAAHREALGADHHDHENYDRETNR